MWTQRTRCAPRIANSRRVFGAWSRAPAPAISSSTRCRRRNGRRFGWRPRKRPTECDGRLTAEVQSAFMDASVTCPPCRMTRSNPAPAPAESRGGDMLTKAVTGLVSAGLLLTGQAAFADHYHGPRYDRPEYDYARVIDVDPIVNHV